MEDLALYRHRIGQFAAVAYKKSSAGRKPKPRSTRKSFPVTKSSKTADQSKETPRNHQPHCRLGLVLLVVCACCFLEGDIVQFPSVSSFLLPGNITSWHSSIKYGGYHQSTWSCEFCLPLYKNYDIYNVEVHLADSKKHDLIHQEMCPAVSHISAGLFNTTTPGSEEPELELCTAVSHISAGLFNMITPGSEEPELEMCTALGHVSAGLFNMTTPGSEEPELEMCTAVSHISAGLFNIITPGSEEPELEMCTAVSHISAGLFNMASPSSEEPELEMCTAVSHISAGLFNMASPSSEEPELEMCTAVSHISAGLFNMASPSSEEPELEMCTAVSHISAGLFNMASPSSEEPELEMCTAVSHISAGLFNMTTPGSEELELEMCTAVSHTSAGLFNMASPGSEEPELEMCTAISHISAGLFSMTFPSSEEPELEMCTAVSHTSAGLFNMTTPGSEEPELEMCTAFSHISAGLFSMTTPSSEEPELEMCTAVSPTSAGLFSMTTPSSEEPELEMCTAVSPTSAGLFSMTFPSSEEPELEMCTALSHISTGLFSMTFPSSEEPELEMCTALSHISTGLFSMTFPSSEELELEMCTALSHISTGLFSMTFPSSEEPELEMCTALSHISTGIFSMTFPSSEELELEMCTALSHISTGLFSMTFPSSKEPELEMCTAVSHISAGLFNMTTPGSEEPELEMCTAVSHISAGLFSMTTPGSEEPELEMCTAVSHISAGLFSMTTPGSEEPELEMCTAVSHISAGLFSMTTSGSEEPELEMCTAVSHISAGLFSMTTPGSEEPELEMCTAVSHISAGLFSMTTPGSEEPELEMCTAVSHISAGLFSMTTPGSEEPELEMCTAVSHISAGLFSMTTPGSEEPELEMCTAVSHISAGLFNMTTPGSEAPYCTVTSPSSKTCCFLLGNKGCHSYNGNPTDMPEAWLTAATLALIKKNVDESVGFITNKSTDINTDTMGRGRGTGFRVGDCYMMTAYHVYRDTIGQLLQDLVFELATRSCEINVEDLLRKLEMTDFRVEGSTESFPVVVEKIFNKFMKETASNTALLVQRLEGLIDADKFTSEFENKWNKNCLVDFINHGQFSVDWKVEFGDEKSDIIIVKLNAKAGQSFPKPMLLDENFTDHGDIHVIRYIHGATPKIIMDQDTQEFKEDAELQESMEAAVQWWKSEFPNESQHFFYDRYKSCSKAHDEESGCVVLRASKSFTYGASGSPIVYLFNNTGQPIVGMIFQRGYPEFFYSVEQGHSPELSRFRGTDVDKKCFFEGGTTMKKAAQLLQRYNRQELKTNVFSSRESDVHVVNIEDLKTLLHTQIAQEFITLRESQAAEIENIRCEVQRLSARMVTREDFVDLLAQHGAGFALPASEISSGNTVAGPGSKTPTDLMDKNVEKWQTVDSTCYVTKAMKHLVDKISKDHYTCVTGVPGSGKSTTIRHAALWLKNNLGFTVYPLQELSEFKVYFDRTKSQVFIHDDTLGEYSINSDKLSAWKTCNEAIKNCLGANTKLLTSLRIQLFEDQTIKGKTYIFNENTVNLGDSDFRLSRDEMEAMLRHYLQLHAVPGIEELIGEVEWEEAERFVECFPLLCKVFSESQSAREDPRQFFRDPFSALTDIFTQIQNENKRQFCGLVLCSVLDLNDDYFSRYSEQELEKDKIELRNVIIETHELDPKTHLAAIKAALETLDGVYITRVGDTFHLSHSIFQNIVVYLCKESSFVLKYGTQQLISDRVRLVKRYPGDNEYVLVYNSDRDVQRLADRFIQELKSDTWGGAGFIALYRCIDEDRLISCLKTQLFDNQDVSQDKIDGLCWQCVYAVCHYRYHDTQDVSDITTWRGYKLLVMLLQGGAQCNRQYDWGMCAIHWAVWWGVLPVIKLLVQYQPDCINSVDEWNHSVLHWAVYPFHWPDSNMDITRYLIGLPDLTCLNQGDINNRTPYWYVVNNKAAVLGDDVCRDRVVPHRQDMIDLYTQTAAILSDDKQ